MAYVYHERQLGNLCGVHCVNNLLQGPRFGPGDLAEIAARLDRKEQRLLRGNSGASREASPKSPCGSRRGARAWGSAGGCTFSENFDDSADGGNFSIQVLRIALARAGLKIVPAEHPDGTVLKVKTDYQNERSWIVFIG